MAEQSRDIGSPRTGEVSSLPSCGDLQVRGRLKSVGSGEEHVVRDLTAAKETRTSLGSLDLAQTASQIHRYTRGEIFTPYLHLAVPQYGPEIPAPGVTHRGRTVTANRISCQEAKEAIEARGFMETFMSFDYNALPSVCAFVQHLKENVTHESVEKYQKEILAKHPSLPREEALERARSKALLAAFHSFTLDSSQDVLHTLGSQCIGLSEAMGQALGTIGLKGYSVVERRDETSPPQHAALVVPCEDGVLLVDLAPPRLLILKPNEESLTVQPGEGTDRIQTGFKIVEVEKDYGVKAPMIVKSETISDTATGEVRHKEQTQFLLRSIARPEIPAMTRYLVNQAIYPLMTKAKSNGDTLRIRFSFDEGTVSFDRCNERKPKESYRTVKIPFSLVDQRTGTINLKALISREKDPEKRVALQQALRDIFGSDEAIEGFWQEFEAPEQIKTQVFTLASQENLKMMQDLFKQVRAVQYLSAKDRSGHDEIRMKINLRTNKVSMERGEGPLLRRIDIPFYLFDPETKALDLAREMDSEKRQKLEIQLQKFLGNAGTTEGFWAEFQEPAQVQEKIFSVLAQKRPPQSRPATSESVPGLQTRADLQSLADHLPEKLPFPFSGVIAFQIGDEAPVQAAHSPQPAKFPLDQPFNVLSVGKLFTATAMMQIIEEDKGQGGSRITLQTPLSDLLTEEELNLQLNPPYGQEKPNPDSLRLLKEHAHEITIEHLLTHRAGLGCIREEDSEESFRPETIGTFQYSNYGYRLLAIIIGKYTSCRQHEEDHLASFYAHIREKIFRPAGMQSAIQELSSPSRPLDCFEVSPTGERTKVTLPEPYPHGNGCFRMSARDLLAFQEALNTNHTLVSSSVLNDMIKHEPRPLGFMRDGSNTANDPVVGYGHPGRGVGMSSFLWTWHQENGPPITGVALSNYSAPLDKDVKIVLDPLMRPAHQPKTITARAAEQFRRLHDTSIKNNLTNRITYAAMHHHESTIREYVALLNNSKPSRKMWTDEPIFPQRSQAIQQGNIMAFLISLGQTPSLPGDSLDRSAQHRAGVCLIVRGLASEIKTIIKQFLEQPENLEKIGLSREHPMYRAVITELMIERASSLLGVDAQEIRQQVATHPAIVDHAFEAKVVIVEFPGLQVDEDTTKDDIPPFLATMTLREKFLLGTLAQLCGKTSLLESLCLEKGQERRSPYEMVTIDSASGPRQLEILCHGEPQEDSTCILMEGGRGESAEAWEKTMEQLPSNTFAVSYSRAGEGHSDKAPEAGLTDQTPDAGLMDKALQDFSALVSKLEREGRIHKPYILVGHSLGGLLMQAYAHLHPGDIKELVLVDSASDVQKPENYPVSPPHPDLMPPSTEELLFPSSVTMLHETKLIRDSQAELRQYRKSSPEKLLGDLPIHVLSSRDTEANPEWREGQRSLSQLSSHVTLVTAPEGVGHDIQREAPQLVIQAIPRAGSVDWGPSERAYLPNLKHEVAEYLVGDSIDPSQVRSELKDHLLHGEELIESIDRAIQEKSVPQFLALLEPVSEEWLSDFIRGLNLPIQVRRNVFPNTFTFTAQSLQELDAYIHDPATGFSGAVTVQDQRGRYTLASAGVDSHAIFSMHSIGKVFTGVLAMRLIQEGTLTDKILHAPLTLDEAVFKELPQKVREHLITNRPTLLEVMQHKGGLGDYLDKYFKEVEREPLKMKNPEDLLHFADEETFPKGEFHYSNLGLLLVGLSLQHIKGKPFKELLNEYVISKSHMECFSSQKPDGALINPDDHKSAHNFGSPAGGYWTTSQDLCAFGSWLSSLWQKEPRFKELVEKYGEEFYPRGGEISHNGRISSASADFSVFPEQGVVLSVLSNKPDQAMKMKKAIQWHMLQH